MIRNFLVACTLLVLVSFANAQAPDPMESYRRPSYVPEPRRWVADRDSYEAGYYRGHRQGYRAGFYAGWYAAQYGGGSGGNGANGGGGWGGSRGYGGGSRR